MTYHVIEATGLTKFYGSRRGVVDVDFEVAEGEAFGFLGPNGAGKTTTIRLMLGFLRATRGGVRLFGEDAFAEASRIHANVGYLGSDPGFLGELTGREQLDYLARLRGLPAGPGEASPSGWSSTRASGSTACRAATARRSASSPRSWVRADAGPRRAHERPRPAHAARVPRARGGGPRGRPDHVPVEPQPRRGGARVRPGGDHPGRTDRRRQHGRRAARCALAVDQPRPRRARRPRTPSTSRTSRSPR